MDYWKIVFSFCDPIENNDEAVELLWDYLSCLYKNGQILKEYELIQCDRTYCAFVTLPEKEALHKIHNNIYVNECLEKIENVFKTSTENVGRNINCEPPCKCKASSWYLLYADLASVESPVVCGDCGREVPLYKLPHILNEQEHFSVVDWQRAYKSIDKLWLYCLSDRFTYRQMSNPTSQLAKAGREICAEFEHATGKPFYYYLFYHHRTKKKCPICGSDWKLTDEKTFVDYKCVPCRVAADEVMS